jgi:AhpD family alkylhydroperoxidase
MARSRGEVEADIKQTLGLVPSFFSRIPDELLAPEWEIFKRLELGETLIPNKYKELMGVALHSETKCHYCTLFHTEAAKLFGATDEEIQEAVHYAKCSLGWSAYLNGIREDYDTFARELAQVGEYMSSQASPVELERVRATVFRATLHAYELAALITAARYVVESAPPEVPDASRDQLRQLLAAYDRQLRRLDGRSSNRPASND